MFETFIEVENFLQIHGIEKGDPLTQKLDHARLTQHRYLQFLNGCHAHRQTTIFLNLQGSQREIPISITYPIDPKTAVPIVYIRGGGWWNGSLEFSSLLVEEISDSSGMPVICVDFGLAPKYQFPEQIYEICTAIKWLRKTGSRYNLDQNHCIIWGDSAGGSLALCMSSELHDIFPEMFLGHVLFYGNFNGPSDLTTPYSTWVWKNYLGDCNPEIMNKAVPLKNPLKGIHQACLVVGSKDPLLLDSKILHKTLVSQNIESDLNIIDNLPHGFLSYLRLCNPARVALLQSAHKAYEFSRKIVTGEKI